MPQQQKCEKCSVIKFPILLNRVVLQDHVKDKREITTVCDECLAEYSKDKNFVVSRTHVLMICDPVDELVDQVRSMSSGIVVPDKKVIA